MSEVQKKDRKAVDEIMGNFDFHRVLEAATALNWKYQGIPVTLDGLRRCALENLLTITQEGSPYISSSTGGFVAERRGPQIHLNFQISNQTAYEDTKRGREAYALS